MSPGLNLSCCLLIYCSDMLIIYHANKETIRLLIISLHLSNRMRSSYAVIWNCLLVFLWPSCDFNLFYFFLLTKLLSLPHSSHLLSVRYEAVQRDAAANPCLIIFHMIHFWLPHAGCRPVNTTLWWWVKEEVSAFLYQYLTVAFEAEPIKHYRCLFLMTLVFG